MQGIDKTYQGTIFLVVPQEAKLQGNRQEDWLKLGFVCILPMTSKNVIQSEGDMQLHDVVTCC